MFVPNSSKEIKAVFSSHSCHSIPCIIWTLYANPEQQLDRMERMLGAGPENGEPIFRTNVGFLPVASTVLIRGERTLLVDPGNFHIGAYSILWHALASRGLDYDDIDAVVTTHTHSDHAAAIVQLAGKPWILGAGEFADISITSAAFGSVISWFPVVLAFAVILFALSTMISWSYYGLKCWTYLFGESKTNENVYKVIFCLFVVVGSAISARAVFGFGDAMIFAMCFPNVLGLYLLMPKVKKALKDYMARVKSGEIKRVD